MRPRVVQPTLLSSASFASSASSADVSTRAPNPEAEAEASPSSRELLAAAAAAQETFAGALDVEGSVYYKSLPSVSSAITSMVYLAGRVWTSNADGKTQIWDARV